jgi:ABC-type sugar transport system ATPase subunit
MIEGARPVLEVRGLSKSYGDARVLDAVDLLVGPGEVHALLGENGAGKSTLIKIVSGVVTPDDGHVSVDGVALRFGSPHEAQGIGVATLFQELATVGGLSVAENVLLGRPIPARLGVVRWDALIDRARQLFATLGQDIDVTQDADRLSPVGRSPSSSCRTSTASVRPTGTRPPAACSWA